MAEDKDNGKGESITIKGVQKNTYDRVKELARETGRTIGEITNESYKIFIATAHETKKAGEELIKGLKESVSQTIENIKTVEITGEELRVNNRKVTFRNIDHLVLKELSENDFENYVASLINIKKLEVPKEIPKLKVLDRSRFIDNIIYI